jgi:hypothetical protein
MLDTAATVFDPFGGDVLPDRVQRTVQNFPFSPQAGHADVVHVQPPWSLDSSRLTTHESSTAEAFYFSFRLKFTQHWAGGTDEAAIPTQQSGVAQAWRFKTGEERVLFMLSRAIEPFLAECLELALIALGRPQEVRVLLPDSFDINGGGD